MSVTGLLRILVSGFSSSLCLYYPECNSRPLCGLADLWWQTEYIFCFFLSKFET